MTSSKHLNAPAANFFATAAGTTSTTTQQTVAHNLFPATVINERLARKMIKDLTSDENG